MLHLLCTSVYYFCLNILILFPVNSNGWEQVALIVFCFFISYMKVTLEAEVTNKGALALYGRLGFIRAKRLFRYYLNGVDAFRLKLLFPRPELSSGHLIIENEDMPQESERRQ